MTHFGDRLTEANRRTATPLCMGIDPHISMIPAIFGNAQDGAGSDAAIRAIDDFSMACLEQAIGTVAAIKPQAAFFEQQGPAGMQILQNLGRAAIDAGLLVIMDAKRGDIGSTSTAYAAGWIGHDAPFPSDALTVNPWLGIDYSSPNSFFLIILSLVVLLLSVPVIIIVSLSSSALSSSSLSPIIHSSVLFKSCFTVFSISS